ncbi:hypothetical protein CSUI_005835 [Cystoisospora suis]|uniref:Uncharacterized protein n=1 Tax=Cystoisospora suis TaxID=483139 RepID=A0A2C6KW56_9APIC|nr:hypothetical protein CSUI_005835 [Cystoisospora suis]
MNEPEVDQKCGRRGGRHLCPELMNKPRAPKRGARSRGEGLRTATTDVASSEPGKNNGNRASASWENCGHAQACSGVASVDR